MHPSIPSFPQVACHCRPVIIPHCQHPSHIFKERHGLQRFLVGLEFPFQTLSHLLLHQPLALPFRSLGTLGSGKVPPVHCTPGHQYVVVGTPWVGEVYLLQNDNGIPDMPLEKVYLHLRPRCCSSRTTLNETVPRSPGGREGHPVCTWLFTGDRGFPTPSPFLCHPILCLHVYLQQPERHLLPILLSMNPNLLHIPVQIPCSCHPSTIRRL